MNKKAKISLLISKYFRFRYEDEDYLEEDLDPMSASSQPGYYASSPSASR